MKRKALSGDWIFWSELIGKRGFYMSNEEHINIAKRNKEIIEKKKAGVSTQKLAEEYGLSRQWIINMIGNESRKAQYENDPLYKAIFNLDLTKTGRTRLYFALRRCGINSLEELKKCTGNELLKKRNIGHTFISLMEDAGLIWC